MKEMAILCVDDEQIVLWTLRNQLEKYFGDRYQCEIAESVEEAWDVIEELQEQETEIVIIISDWLMPDVRGDRFLIDLHQRFPNIVTILLSGQADEEAVEGAFTKGKLYSYLPKPWNETTLIDTVRSALKQFNT
jgi:DNA-binding NtrC family response regulator